MTRIGLISDTHGLMRPEALAALEGVAHIVHAGDIGSAEILAQLAKIAPVTAVRGNNDEDKWARDLPETDVLEIDGRSIYVLHELSALDLDPSAAGFSAVITGHSHKPAINRRDGVLFVNPGSAGPRRFKLPITVASLVVTAGQLDASIQDLFPAPSD